MMGRRQKQHRGRHRKEGFWARSFRALGRPAPRADSGSPGVTRTASSTEHETDTPDVAVAEHLNEQIPEGELPPVDRIHPPNSDAAAAVPKGRGGVGKAFLVMMSASAGTILLSLITGVLTARFLGTDGRGQVSAISSWTLTLTWASSLGFATSMVYYLNKGEATRRQTLTAVLMAVPLLGAIGVGLGHALLPWGFAAQTEETKDLARLFFFGVPFMIACEAMGSLLIAYHAFKALSAIRIAQPLLYAVGLGVLLLAGHFTPFWVLLTQTVSYAVPALAAAAILIGRIGLGKPGRALMTKGLGYGLRLQGVNFGQLVTTRLDLMMLPAFVSAAAIGYYSISVSIASMVMSLFGSLSSVVLPVATRDGDSTVVGRGLRVSILGGAALAIPLGLLSPWLISFVYGEEFVGAVPALLLLLPGIVAYAATSILNAAVQAAGRPGSASVVQLIGMVVTVVTLILFLPRWGIEGAAASSSIAYIVTLVLTVWVLRRATGFSLSAQMSPQLVRADVRFIIDRVSTVISSRLSRR